MGRLIVNEHKKTSRNFKISHFEGIPLVIYSALAYWPWVFEMAGGNFNCTSMGVGATECENSLVELFLKISGAGLMMRIFTFGAGLILDVFSVIYLVQVLKLWIKKS